MGFDGIEFQVGLVSIARRYGTRISCYSNK